VAGSADFRHILAGSTLLDKRLREVFIKNIDTSYGGLNGFEQAIKLSLHALNNVKFIQEVKLVGIFISEIAADTGKVCFGFDDTLLALEMGAVETIIVWEDLELICLELKHMETGELTIRILSPEDNDDAKGYVGPNGVNLELQAKMLLVERLVTKFNSFGTTLELITDNSAEGSQFCRGFDGVGGIMRWPVDFYSFQQPSESQNRS